MFYYMFDTSVQHKIHRTRTSLTNMVHRRIYTYIHTKPFRRQNIIHCIHVLNIKKRRFVEISRISHNMIHAYTIARQNNYPSSFVHIYLIEIVQGWTWLGTTCYWIKTLLQAHVRELFFLHSALRSHLGYAACNPPLLLEGTLLLPDFLPFHIQYFIWKQQSRYIPRSVISRSVLPWTLKWQKTTDM